MCSSYRIDNVLYGASSLVAGIHMGYTQGRAEASAKPSLFYIRSVPLKADERP